MGAVKIDYEIYKIICTNCVYNCNGEMKQIQETQQRDVTTWKCINFNPIYKENRDAARKQFCNVFLNRRNRDCIYNNRTKLY